MARPAFQPTHDQRKLVEQLAAFGIPHADICSMVLTPAGKPISEPTLRKHFATELATGALKANVKVAQNLFRIATGEGKGAVTAAIFWLKTRGHWKETTKVEMTGENGAPVAVTTVSKEEFLAARKEILDDF